LRATLGEQWVARDGRSGWQHGDAGRETGGLRTFTRREWLGAAALVLLVLIAYWPATQGGFVWDDDANLTENWPLRSVQGLRALWLQPGVTTQYYPLVYTSFWLEYRLFELTPFGYHLDNLLLHAGASVVLWRLLVGLALPGAWLVAAVFAIHPLQVETVAWVTERKNLLSFFFYVSAAFVYLRSVTDLCGTRPRSWTGYAASLLLYLAALLSKVTAVTLPPALLLLVWWKKGRLRAADVLLTLPMFALAIPIGLMTRSMEAGLGTTLGFDWSPGLAERLIQGASAICFYLQKLIWPSGLAFVYPRFEIDPGSAWSYLPVVFVVGLCALFFALRGRIGRGPLTALLFFVGTLAPVLGLLEVYFFRFSFVADHWQYVACIGPIALIVGGGARWASAQPERAQTIARVAAGTLLVVLATLTWQKSWTFSDPVTLWRDSLSKNPDSLLARYNLGAELHRRARLGEAMEQYRLAHALSPESPPVLVNMGLILAGQGRSDEAIALYERALELDPNGPIVHWNLGIALLERGETERGLLHLERSLAIAGKSVSERRRRLIAHTKLGDILQARPGGEQNARAIHHYRAALLLAPDHAPARIGLAQVWLASDQPAQAITILEPLASGPAPDPKARALLERARRALPR
jgi:tetratricopeptide (TPR) repeat protein